MSGFATHQSEFGECIENAVDRLTSLDELSNSSGAQSS